MPDVAAVRAYLESLQDRICDGLEAEDGPARFRRDVIAANSACPSDITPTNAHRPTPMRFVLYEPDGRAPTGARPGPG